MEQEKIQISESRLEQQREWMRRVRETITENGARPLAMVDTYGCQQNEADSQRIRGQLAQMGYGMTDDEFAADVIVINSCAVREHAESRVFGNIGALSHAKRAKPGLKIILCGCMAAEEGVRERIKRSYPYVDLCIPPDAIWRLPELLWERMTGGKRRFLAARDQGSIAEGLPELRDGDCKAWVSVMYGCNNFCSYCIVPYVRGRERSREPERIEEEVRGLVAAGYRDITLLGQNVNSYGKDLDREIDFAALLERLAEIPGDYLLRFMTSHPKDASERLFQVMSRSPRIAKQLHLPFQAGNDEVLRRMNRGYTAEKYAGLVERARALMPDLVITSDVIVGFPGETEAQFEDTVKLIERLRFDALFTFIYSPRAGTPAAKMEDPVSRKEKQRWFDRLLEVQNTISAEKHAAYVGRTLRVLVDGPGQTNYQLAARTQGGRLVHLSGDESLIGRFVDVTITGSSTWALFGEVQDPTTRPEGA